MIRSIDRIQVTHAGSLPRSAELIAANEAMMRGGHENFNELLTQAVDSVVKKQLEVGVTIPNDGEYGKTMVQAQEFGSWWSYIFERTGGLEVDESDTGWLTADIQSTSGNVRTTGFANRRDFARFADAYADPKWGVAVVNATHAFPSVIGPLTYEGAEAVARDTSNLRAALDSYSTPAEGTRGFINAIAPGSAIRLSNRFYADDDDYVNAWAEILAPEYRAIVDAGFQVQIDDPSLAENWDQITPEPSVEDYVRFSERNVAALNKALEGIDPANVRYHLCWGSWHGPHTTDLEFKHIVNTMLQVNAQAFSFEAGNVRHEHEWTVWEDVTLPEGKVILPGVVSHATNVVEHPELVAQRLERFARLVGPENVIASTDCGLGGRVQPDIAWAKLESLSAGAEIASGRLF